MKNLIVFITFTFTICSYTMAQEKLTGTLSSWDKGKANIIMGMTGEPFAIGTLDESGTFSIPLTDDILVKTKKAMEEYNKSTSGGQFRLNTIEKAFSCWGGDSLEVENGDQHATTLATMGTMQIADLEQKKMYGDFMAASSEEFANYFTSFGQLDAVKGFYLNWYYLEEPASINGQCAVETYARNQKDSYQEIKAYDLDFKKGWNIVKSCVDETFADSDGKTYTSKWTYRTIDEMPAETQFISWIEQH